MDKIPPAANAKVTRYSLKYNEKDITITIHETDMSITIYVGNDSLYCIDAKILKTVNGELYEVGYLSKIGGCEDSLIKVLLSYIQSNYPVGAVSFSDMSWAYGQINLAAFNYLTVRRVWFEDIYDGFASARVSASASAADIVYEQKLFYRQLEFKLLDKKQKTPWEQISAYIPVDKLSLPVEEVRELYMKAATWQDFFRPIVERLGEKERVYMIFSSWFHAFVTGYLGMSYISLQYILPVKDYGVEYTVKEDNPKSTEASGSLQA